MGLRPVGPVDLNILGHVAGRTATSLRWLPVAESATPDRVQAALTSGVALQWISESHHPRAAPRALIQFDSLDLRSRTAQVHVQALVETGLTSDVRIDIEEAFLRARLAYPLRRIYAEIVDRWLPLYESILPSFTHEATIAEYFFVGGRYADKLILTVAVDDADV